MSLALLFGLILIVTLRWPNHAYPVLTAFFATTFVVTVILLLLGNSATALPSLGTVARSATPRPPLVHLVLDGHIGLDGVPQDVPRGPATHDRLRSFYTQHGFTLFSGAFSRYRETHSALSHAMNFSMSAEELAFVGEHGESYRLTANAYFNTLERMGYSIDVVQSRYISLCPTQENGTDDEPVSEAVRCYEYASDALGLLRSVQGLLSERLDALWSAYLRRSLWLRRALYYYRLTTAQLAESGVALPELWRPDFTPLVAPIASLATLDMLIDRVRSVGPGQALVAHLILPHGPYLYRGDCSVGLSIGELRKYDYQSYFGQLHCLYAKLETLVEQMRAVGIYDDAVLIVHGDHGSRISRTGSTNPFADEQGGPTAVDLLDFYSTLFAVKMPGSTASIELAPLGLEQLLARVVSELGETRGSEETRAGSFVYVGPPEQGQLRRVPYPALRRQP